MASKFNQAQFIADKFGGRVAFAKALGFKYHTVANWCRGSGLIPEDHRLACLRAAEANGVDLTAFDFVRHLVSAA